ncbi:MAG: restriction endonuclease subunit S [Lachnospiraceae bacterium]|jgi:type I restriction enzyme S subunit
MKYKLEELCEFITDGTHQTPKYCEEGGVMFLSSKDVTARKIDWDNVKHIPESLHEKLYARLSPRKDDILLAKNGTTGVAALVDRDEIFDVYVSLAVLRPKDIVYPKYLLYAINSPVVKKQFDAGLKGVGVPNLHLSVIRKTEINIEKYGKQLEVCGILDKVASIIDARKEELQKLDELIKARFVELFGDVKTGVYKFKTRKLGEVAIVGSSHRVFTTEFVENGVPFYRGTEIGELANGIKPENPYRITKEHYDRLASDETKPQIGDLLMPSICNKGQVWMVDTDEPFYYKDGRVLCISPNRKLFNCKYLEQFMREKTLVEYPKLGSGSTFAEFKIFLLKDIDVLIPPIELQNQFAAFVKQIDKSKVA